MLEDFNDVLLESLEVALDRDQIVSVVVLLNDLLVEAMVDSTMNNVWVIGSIQLASCSAERCGLSTQELNVLLCGVAGLLDFLCALACAGRELFRLVLDFLVKTFEDWENGALEVLLGFEMRVYNTLR